MRCRHDSRMVDQGQVGRRLLFVDVESGPGDVAGFERLQQRRFVDQPAAGAVDDACTGLHLLDRVRVDHVMRFIGPRHVQRDDIGTPQ